MPNAPSKRQTFIWIYSKSRSRIQKFNNTLTLCNLSTKKNHIERKSKQNNTADFAIQAQKATIQKTTVEQKTDLRNDFEIFFCDRLIHFTNHNILRHSWCWFAVWSREQLNPYLWNNYWQNIESCVLTLWRKLVNRILFR